MILKTMCCAMGSQWETKELKLYGLTPGFSQSSRILSKQKFCRQFCGSLSPASLKNNKQYAHWFGCGVVGWGCLVGRVYPTIHPLRWVGGEERWFILARKVALDRRMKVFYFSESRTMLSLLPQDLKNSCILAIEKSGFWDVPE